MGDVSILDKLQGQPEKPRRKFRSVVGWVIFALIAAFFAWFGWRIVYYMEKIQNGEIVELPQYEGRLTASGLASSVPNKVDPGVVIGEAGKSLGPEDAALTVTVFADFECPYSKESYSSYRSLMAKHEDVRFVFRDYPLESIHPNARQAALAGECAREQDRFWAYHDKLFVNAPALSFQDLLRYADEVGLESRQFESCLAEQRYAEKVDVDSGTAQLLGLRGTPTFFFNGNPVEGAIPKEDMERIIGRLK